jgi:NADH-quinone oxidoreductase subunit F
MMIQDFAAFSAVRETGLAKLLPSRPRIAVGMGTCGSGNGAEAVYSAFASEIDARGLAVDLVPIGCFGFCAEEPLVNVWVPGRPLLVLHRVRPEHVDAILNGLGQGALPATSSTDRVTRTFPAGTRSRSSTARSRSSSATAA